MGVNQHRQTARTGDFAGVTRTLQNFLAEPRNLEEVTAALRRELVRREIYFGGQLLPSFPIPDLIPAELEQTTIERVERFAVLLESLGAQILDSRDLRDAVGLAPEADPLLEIDPGYDQLVVISRLDMTSAESGLVFEANTDSPAMMTYTDQLEDIYWTTAIGDIVGAAPSRLRRTRVMLDGILACYKQWGGTRDDPTIAIVDWADQMTANELLHTARAFSEMGCQSVVCTPADLSITNGQVHARGRRIDIIQRRVLFLDFIERADELATFTEAYRRSLVCVVNPLRSIAVGNKAILGLLSEQSQGVDLSADDRELLDQMLPQTIRVTPDRADRLLEEREEWVLKCSFGSGGKAVLMGVATSDADWASWIDMGMSCVTVAQRKQPIRKFTIPVLQDGAVVMRELYSNWNPWIFAGRYASGSTRVSEDKLVSISAGGGLLPSIGI